MRLLFIPRYSREAASSRLRVYVMAEQIQRAGLANVHVGAYPDPAGISWADVVIVQKSVDYEILKACSEHKRVIYDWDDWMGDGAMAEWQAHSRLLTTDTEIHAKRITPASTVWPDPIDYGAEPQPAAVGSGALAWFGCYACYPQAKPLFESLDAQLVTITDREVIPHAGFIPWSYDGFPGLLRAAGTAFLSHAGGDTGKSNNKLTAAVTLGVPVIAGAGSPSYEADLRTVGLDWSIVATPDELRGAYERLQVPSERVAYLSAIQSYCWSLYRPEVVARRLMEIVNSL